MKICFVSELPADKSGLYVDYQHRRVERERDGWTFCDIRAFLRTSGKNWLELLDKWHGELSQVGVGISPWWWITNISRFFPCYPHTIKPLLFAVGLVELSETVENEEIYLVGFPNTVGTYLRELKGGWQICFENDKANKRFSITGKPGHFFMGKGLLYTLKLILKNAIFWSRMMAHCVTKRSDSLPKKHRTDYQMIAQSIIFDEEKIIKEGDYYFGTVFDSLETISKKDILLVYSNGPSKKRTKLREYKKITESPYLFLENLISISDCFKALIAAVVLTMKLRIVKKKMPSLMLGSKKCSTFPKEYWNICMSNDLFIASFFVYFSMKRLLTNFRSNVLIYPYEERGFERAILKACSEMENPPAVIGYHRGIHQHSHIFYRTRPESMANPPRPDIVGVGGPAEKKWFIDVAKAQPSKVSVIGSTRYLKPLAAGDEEKRPHSPLRILVLTGAGSELMILANYIEARNDLFEGTDVIVRKKLYGIQTEADLGIERLKRGRANIRIEKKPLIAQIEWCDVALYCITTAGFEAMLLGRLAIYVDLCDLILVDPIEGKGDSEGVTRCFCANELKEALDRVRNMTKDEYVVSVRNQIRFAEQSLSAIDEKELCRLIGKTS